MDGYNAGSSSISNRDSAKSSGIRGAQREEKPGLEINWQTAARLLFLFCGIFLVSFN